MKRLLFHKLAPGLFWGLKIPKCIAQPPQSWSYKGKKTQSYNLFSCKQKVLLCKTSLFTDAEMAVKKINFNSP